MKRIYLSKELLTYSLPEESQPELITCYTDFSIFSTFRIIASNSIAWTGAGYRRLCSEQKMGLSVKQTDSRRVFLLCCSTIYHTARRKRSALACRRSIITFFDRLKINRKRRNRDRKLCALQIPRFQNCRSWAGSKYDQKGAASI